MPVRIEQRHTLLISINWHETKVIQGYLPNNFNDLNEFHSDYQYQQTEKKAMVTVHSVNSSEIKQTLCPELNCC